MRRISQFPLHQAAFVLLIIGAMVLAARGWLADHPQHDPFAPLDLREPRGWATQAKIDALRSDPALCRSVLDGSGIAFTALPATGEGECRRDDRMLLDTVPLAPAGAQLTCPVAVGMALWIRQDLQPIAEAELGARVARIEHMGTYNCRRIGGGEEGQWSEHATGNAIDIAAFVLNDGRRIGVLADWPDDSHEARFLRAARDAACASFGTVLSPDYNAAHADHLHLDQGRPVTFGYCR